MKHVLLRRRQDRLELLRADRVPVTMAVLATGLILLAGMLAMFGTYHYLDVLEQIEAVRRLPELFDDEGFLAPVVYDRTGETELFSFHHPATEERVWLEPVSLDDLQLEVLFALIDPEFPAGGGVSHSQLIGWLAGTRSPGSSLNISQRVVHLALTPDRQALTGDLIGSMKVALLAERLSEQFPADQILTWFLNGIYFGNGAYGLDSAALLYFGKHADELEIAELALLIRVAEEPALNPIQAPNIARLRQADAMDSLAEAGLVSKRSLREALREPAEFAEREPDGRFGTEWRWVAEYIHEQFLAAVGADAVEIGGLQIVSSIDAQAQAQARCVLQAQLARLQGQRQTSGGASDQDSLCPAAAALPPPRPGDIGVDHEVHSGAALLSDPTTGHILAMTAIGAETGSLEAVMPGEAFYPMIYLAAFAQGSSPGTMVLDIAPQGDLEPGQGPVRIRTAMANGYHFAALRTLQEAGLEDVQRISLQMDVDRLEWAERRGELAEFGTRTSLLGLSQAFAILANDGRRVSVELPAAIEGPGFVLAVSDPNGRILYEPTGQIRAVLSRELAYMVNDVLRDETARQITYGASNLFEIGRPVAVVAGSSTDESSFVTIGYTPDALAAVWVGNTDGHPTADLDRGSAAAPAWQALMRFMSSATPVTDWSLPPGLVEVEVCDPSGLLPSEDCPTVVSELFPVGGEPVVVDDMFQTVRVNQETGRLATVETPIDQVIEQVYLIPPPEAQEWAERVNLPRPPEEYDDISEQIAGRSDARLHTPEMFEIVAGEVIVRGHAHSQDFDFYRLQFGQGLNPDRWIQIGEDVERRVWGGILGQWDTTGLSGLYTIQLLAVNQDGTVESAAVPVTVDNEQPSVTVTYPFSGQILSDRGRDRFLVEVRAADNVDLASVSLYVDGRLVKRLTEAPYLTDLHLPGRGSHALWAVAEDSVGNTSQSAPLAFTVSGAQVGIR